MHINFWLDKWMPSDRSLMNLSTQQTITLAVKDALTGAGDWDINFLATHLPHNMMNQVVAIPTPKDMDGPYAIGGLEPILVTSLYKVPTTSNESVTFPMRGVGKAYGIGRVLTKFKLSCGLRPINVSLLIIVEADGGLGCPPLAQFVEMKMKRQSMC
jgi:hypothetical protein